MCSICFNTEHLTSENAAGIDANLGDAGNYSNNYINGLIWGGGWSGTVYYTIDQGTYGGSGWTATQITAIQNAVAAYNNVCGINISYVAPGNATVDIVFATLDNATFTSSFGISALAIHEVPADTNYVGTADVCYGVYNYSYFSADTDSFDIGGYDYITLIHELGHGLGLAHPHDNGGSSSIFPGVTSSFGDYGDNNLNQGVFTTMSYNDGWKSEYPSHTDVGYGYQGTPMAFDIAALQVLYGANNSYQTGDNSYALPSYNQQNDNTYWSCIWDAGGTDRIYNPTSSSSIINLQEAPLTGANAGGYLSYVSGIKGGFTIANGVVIERAYGGSSTDTITGNSANNILNGNGGNDTIYGGGGNDTIDGGGGNDTMYGGAGDDTFKVDSASDSVTENSSEGTDTVESGVTFTLGNNIENLTLTGASENTNGTGNSLNNIIIGDGWRNILTGGDGNDTLNGGGCGGGQDTLSGGAGDDTYYVYAEGSGLTNIIEGASAGNDTIISSVSYNLNAYAIWVENLTLTGGSEAKGNGLNNIITADSGSDTLYGYGGNDTLDGGSGADTMIGGIGDDIYILDNVSDAITENSGQGTDTSKSSTISIDLRNYSNVENATLTGSSNLNLTGSNSTVNNILTGNSGNNTLNGLDGSDTLIGGDGNDTYQLTAGASWSDDTIVELIGGGTDTVETTGNYTLHNNVENITLLSNGGYTLIGNNLNNTIRGAEGNDTIDGAGGNDSYYGGDGNDIYVVDDSYDVITEGSSAGTDTVRSSSISLNLSNYANVENLTLTGSSNYNLTGNSSNNTLTGNNGNNVIDGGAGNDTMIGGAGNDTYVVNTIFDTVTEASDEGTDTIQSDVSLRIPVNVENLILLGSAITANGNSSNNVITGNSLNNNLNGGSGADNLYGGEGNDTLNGGLGIDRLEGGNGNDIYIVGESADRVVESLNAGTDTIQSTKSFTIPANVENLILIGNFNTNGAGNSLDNVITGNNLNNNLRGGGGRDTLNGDIGNDILEGGTGNDILNGGEGNDTLVGGTELDIFLFDTVLDEVSNVDTLIDFNIAQDKIRLDKDIFSALSTIGSGNFVSGFGAAALQTDDHLIFNTANNYLYYDADGSGAGAMVHFATLNVVIPSDSYTSFELVA